MLCMLNIMPGLVFDLFVHDAGNRSRTYDLFITNELLYQLSYPGLMIVIQVHVFMLTHNYIGGTGAILGQVVFKEPNVPGVYVVLQLAGT